MPFPNIKWWCYILDQDTVKFDGSEYFEKMTFRNRYYVATANGAIKLSIPMRNGRDQKIEMTKALISYDHNWQLQHWRTLVSAYNRSPYFEFYAASLEQLFTNKYDSLITFNLASIQWLKQQLGLSFAEEITTIYQKEYGENIIDLRKMKPVKDEKKEDDYPKYFQVFEDKVGFIENLSMLDLLFAEGPYALSWIKENKKNLIEF